MRLISVLAISIALATAGCFGGDEEPAEQTPIETSPTPPTAPDDDTAGAGNETGEDGAMGNETAEEEEAPLPPQQVVTGTADFSNPAAPPEPLAGTVPEGYSTGNLTVTFTPVTGALAVSSGITVTFTDAAGNTLTCTLTTNPLTETETCVQEGPIAPGEATVEFAGEGPVKADVTVTATG